MSRHYCPTCGKRRMEKFMKKSNFDKFHYCYRSVRGYNFELSCYEKHVISKISIIKSSIMVLNSSLDEISKPQLKLYVQGDNLSEVKMSIPVDKNQTNILTQIIENEKQKTTPNKTKDNFSNKSNFRTNIYRNSKKHF